MLPDRAGNAQQWEFDKLVTILLRQFKRLLAHRDVDLSEATMRKLGEDANTRTLDDSQLAPICDALADIVQESVEKLGEWQLTFAQSLNTEMTNMPDWETTAEFLDVANEKINAEVRISAGSSLMVALGDRRNIDFLLQAVTHDLNTHNQLDVDAVIAKRALCHTAQVDHTSNDWLEHVQAWAKNT